jgi:hypothetical protein
MKARYEMPEVGRFTSQDPLYRALGDKIAVRKEGGFIQQELLRDPQRTNSYSYAGNNPLRYIDPDGKDYIEINGDIDLPGFSFSLSLKIDPYNGKVDVGGGIGASWGASASLTGTYNTDDLPEENEYKTVSYDFTVVSGVGVAARGSATVIQNRGNNSTPVRVVNVGGAPGVGIGTGFVSSSVTISQNKRIFDYKSLKENYTVNQLKDKLKSVVKALKAKEQKNKKQK